MEDTYICINVKTSMDSSASTESNLISSDGGLGSSALNINASCVTTEKGVLSDVDLCLRKCLHHDAARLEVS